MIIYFRYILYEYIKQNWNKVYNKEFPVKIGNLLPNQYETEFGDFLFENFFDEQLMQLNTDAEKIVIYLTPYVLKINLNIIMYSFDTDSSVLKKEFSSNLNGKIEINLLYRKTHYDIIYDSYYFEKYSNFLCYYVNLDETLKVIDSKSLETYKTAKRCPNEKNADSKISIKENEKNNKNVGLYECSQCKSTSMQILNALNFCINCLNNELSNQIMSKYLIFISEALISYREGKENEIKEIFQESKKTK